jgi:arylformamidase
MIEIGPVTAPHDHPIEELRQVLDHLRLALIRAGAGPHHLVRMVWTTSDPIRLDPADFTVDLIYREVFAGFKPPIELVAAPSGAPRLSIHATVSVPGPASVQTVWRGYDLANLAREYSPRLQVPAVAPIFERWSRDGAAFLRAHDHREIAYGTGPRERFDLLMPSGIARPRLHIFIHGGYWQALDKGGHAQFTRTMLAAGFAVAVLNYSLAPEKPLAGLVDEIWAAVAFLWRSADELGLARQPFDLAGHSAGAHLGAMAITVDWTVFGLPADIIASATLLSGLYELEPVSHLPMALLLGLDRISAHLMSPVHARAPRTRVLLAVGEQESEEFKHQTAQLAAAWKLPAGQHRLIPGHNHFTVLDAFAEGPLSLLALKNAAP